VTREGTKEIIEIMQHYVDGGEIERHITGKEWVLDSDPGWYWDDFDYRPAGTIRLFAWIDPNGKLGWYTNEFTYEHIDQSWQHVPSEDKWVEIDDPWVDFGD